MTDLEKAARMALEALGWYERETHEKAIAALRQALEQPAKRPWQQIECPVCGELARAEPPRKPWVGLSLDEKHALNDALNLNGRFAVIDTIEAKLKEKNT